MWKLLLGRGWPNHSSAHIYVTPVYLDVFDVRNATSILCIQSSQLLYSQHYLGCWNKDHIIQQKFQKNQKEGKRKEAKAHSKR